MTKLKYVFCLLATFALVLNSSLCVGQRPDSNAQEIAPVRPGDQIEVRKFSTDWKPGKVLSYANGRAEVEYEFGGSTTTGSYADKDMRFANGEGHWMIWKAPRKKIKVEGRYLTRDDENVMILQADGSELVIPIEDLTSEVKKIVRMTPIPGEENHINGADPVRKGDRVQVYYFSKWYSGVVEGMTPGKASVTYESSGRSSTKEFSLEDVRFPNGEGFWREWADASGKFKIIARYISRTKTEVTIRKEDGSEVTLPIKLLDSSVRKDVTQRPVTGEENLIGGVSPLRVGDKVQVKSTWSWVEGVVVELGVGKALIERLSEGEKGKEVFDLAKVRFPNGEGHWQKWKSSTGDSEIIARYLNRDATHAILRKEDGKTIRVPTEKLDTKRRRQVEKAVVMSELPEKMKFDLSPSTNSYAGHAPDFATVALPRESSATSISPPKDGGFGFELENGNLVSTVVAGDGSDQWVAIGTYPDRRYDGYPLTRLYWAKPGSKKMKPGPGFRDDERVVDYSHDQHRLITLQFSRGTWPQPIAFCTYRIAPGDAESTPETRWDVDDIKSSYFRGDDYLARLVGDNQLLLANGNTLSLYDFGSAKIVYQIEGLQSNHFTLHPSKAYFLLDRPNEGLTLHRTDTGQMVAAQKDIKSNSGVGFSQDGKKIVCIESKNVSIWDITQDVAVEKRKSRNLSSARKFYGTKTRVSLLNDTWLWSNSLLYSIEKELVVWNYAAVGVTIAESEMLGDRLLITGTQTRNNVVTLLVGVAEVPHKEAVQEIEKVDADAMIMVREGVGVKVVATGNSSVIRESLDAVMKANGWREDPLSEIVLSGSAQRGETQSNTYQHNDKFGRRIAGSKNFTLSYTPWVQEIKVSYHDRSSWRKVSSTGAPGGARTEAELSKASAENNKPNYDLFKDLEIPSELVYPIYVKGLGMTAITSGGFVDKVYPPPVTDSQPFK
ncbi:hypothetical protein OAG71_01535 [bacterium]|nr:hypothetical protein [bacterium]